MKILVITGSPHFRGTTARLADEFCAGARELGFSVDRIDAARLAPQPCVGCRHCQDNGGACVYKDEMKDVLYRVIEADAVVLVTPLYYFGMTAQLKALIDRFFAMDDIIRRGGKLAALIAAGTDPEPEGMAALELHYESLCRYLRWEDRGRVLALGAPTRESLEGSEWLPAARRLAQELLPDSR